MTTSKKELQAALRGLIDAHGVLVNSIAKGASRENMETLAFIAGLADATTGTLVHLKEAINLYRDFSGGKDESQNWTKALRI